MVLFTSVAFSVFAASPDIILQRGHEIEVSAAIYSPDGRIIASAGEREAIRLWERESGDLVGTLPGLSERLVGLAFSPNGKWLASASTDGTVTVWDYRAGLLLHRLTNHVGHWVRRVAFSPDSQWLVPAAYDRKLSIWNVTNGAVVRTLSTQRRIADVLFSPDGQFVVTASREENLPVVQFWDAATGEPRLTLSHSNSIHTLALSRNGKLLAVGGNSAAIQLWEIPSGRPLRTIAMAAQERVSDVDLSPDGRLLAAGGQWVNAVWTTDSGKLLHEMRGHDDTTSQISFSPDGDELMTGSSDATLRLWRVRDGALKRVFDRRPPNTPVTTLAFSLNGRFEALGTANGLVRVWDGHDGSFKYNLRGHEGSIHALAFSADNAWLFSGSADRLMRVWDMAHGTVSAYHPYFDRIDAMGTLAVGGTEGLVASASGPMASATLDHTIKLWLSHFDRPTRILTGHAANVRSVAFTPGTDLLASASVDGTVKVWNSRSGQCLRTLTNAVLPEVIAFLAGTKTLAAGMADGEVRVLDTATLRTIRAWTAHQRPVQSLAISGDGRWIATASADGSVAVWNSESGAILRRFDNVTSQYLPLAFAPGRPVLAFAQRDDTVVHANFETGEILFQRVIFPDGEWIAWNPAKAFYMASARGDEHARIRFPEQLAPVYPLSLYRTELRRATHVVAALADPAPALVRKNLALWWHRYPYKNAWLYGGLSMGLLWIAFRLRRGWIAERRRRTQENISRQLIVSQEAERKRIAAELHDSLGQNLLIIKNRLYLAQRDASGAVPTEQLEEISKSVTQTIEEVREISYNLRPYQLDRLGLTKAIQSVVKKIARSGSLTIDSDITGLDGAFSPEGEINFYRIVQESLSNILKHSDAATARISIEQLHGKVRMNIEDDGIGFDYRGMMHDSKRPRGFGLTGLAERVRILQGRFECDSAPSQGTRLKFEFPASSNHERLNQDPNRR